MSTTQREPHPLERYLRPLQRWWYVVVAVLLLGLLITWATLPGPDRAADEVQYRATHILILDGDTAEPPNFELLELLAAQGELTNRVLDRLPDGYDAGDVEGVQLDTNREIGTLSVTAVQPTQTRAGELATTFADELNLMIGERQEVERDQQLARAQERADELGEIVTSLQQDVEQATPGTLAHSLAESELEAILGEYGSAQANVRQLQTQVDDVSLPFETIQEPSPVQVTDESPLGLPEDAATRLAIAAVMALLAGFLLVLGIDSFDNRIRTREDTERATGLPVIAELPHRPQPLIDRDPLPVVSEPAGPTAEAFRALRLAVLLAPVWRLSGRAPSGNGAIGTMAPIEGHGAPRTLVVTSPATGDGKTTIVANLAASFAESGQSVLIVDCDFRRPAVAKLFDDPPGPGLQDSGGPHKQPLSELVIPTRTEGVSLVRAGTPGITPPWFLLHSKALVEQAAELADVVIFDTGPLLLTNEAAALVPSVDTVVLATRASKLSYDQAADSVEHLARVGATVAGVVLVGTRGGSRYGYYQPHSEDAPKVGPAAS